MKPVDEGRQGSCLLSPGLIVENHQRGLLYAAEGGGLQAGVSSAWVCSAPPLTLRSDGSYSKRVPVAVEQPVLYTSPFRRWKLLVPVDSM